MNEKANVMDRVFLGLFWALGTGACATFLPALLCPDQGPCPWQLYAFGVLVAQGGLIDTLAVALTGRMDLE